MMQGDVITPVKEAGDWVGIEPPEQAVAYIASQFVELQTPEEEVQETPAESPGKHWLSLVQRRPSSSSTILKEKAVRCCRQRFQAISLMIVQPLWIY